MTKRFTETVSTGDVHDILTGKSYRCEYRIDDEFLELVNNIAEENEQLKCENTNLKAVLNDFINILNRLQSNPNDKQTLNVARDMLQNMGKELEE